MTFPKTSHPLRPGPPVVARTFVETPFGGVLESCETHSGRADDAVLLMGMVRTGAVRVVLPNGASALAPAGHVLVGSGVRAIEATFGVGTLDAYVWLLRFPSLAESLAERVPMGALAVFPCQSLAQSLEPGTTETAALARALRAAANALVVLPGVDLAQHEPIEDPGTATVVRRLKERERFSLREAAEEAGYSHFHFSRRFRDVTGYGFHEFGDRVRTSAVLNTLDQSVSLSDLAACTGFPNVKAMQESVLDYTGFALRDLRGAP